LIKYAAINKLLLQSRDQELGPEDGKLVSRSQRIIDNRISYNLLAAIGADRNRSDLTMPSLLFTIPPFYRI
jgi:hypothetical protein